MQADPLLAPHRAPPAPGVVARGRTAAPVALVVIATVIAAAMLLPLAYLLLRAADVGLARALEYLVSLRVLVITWNSLLLAFLVTSISLAISLPLAWLTVRTKERRPAVLHRPAELVRRHCGKPRRRSQEVRCHARTSG